MQSLSSMSGPNILRSHDAAAETGGGTDRHNTVKLPREPATEMIYSMTDLLKAAFDYGASDLHLQIGDPPIFRVNGAICRAEGPQLTQKSMDELIRSILPDHHKVEFDKEGSADFAFDTTSHGRFRVNVFKENQGPSAVLRLLPSKIRSIAELNLPWGVEANLLSKSNGLVLVVGSTGTGKSTSLAAMVDHLNRTRNDLNIITLEAPIEFVHKSKLGVVRQREVGVHTPTFERGVRDAMRQNPDVILVGEIRDPETMRAALQAAETGHLVFGTLHTTGSAKTVDRVLGFFDAKEKENIKTQLSTVLRGIVSQVLIPRIDEVKQGQPGRVAAFEVMIANPAIANSMRELKLQAINDAIQTGAKEGMVALDTQLLEHFEAGRIAEEHVMQKCLSDKALMQQRLIEIKLRTSQGGGPH